MAAVALLGGAGLLAGLAGTACNQDAASSNDGRETHMGDVRAAITVADEPPDAGIPTPGAAGSTAATAAMAATVAPIPTPAPQAAAEAPSGAARSDAGPRRHAP